MKATVYWRGVSVRLNGLGARHEQAWFRGEKPTGGVYPAATIQRGCARIAAGTRKRGNDMKATVYWRGLSVRLNGLGARHEQAWFGGPCRG